MRVDPDPPGTELVPSRRGCRIGCLVALLAALGLLIVLVLEDLSGWWVRARAPRPAGLVLQVELREVLSPFDEFEVLAVERDGPAIAIVDPMGLDAPARVTVVRYPSGEVLERIASASAGQLEGPPATPWPARAEAFDFDGDGLEDEVVIGRGDGWVHVRSGAGGALLWSSHDPLEYESNDRLTPLPDLDGDGCSELAVLHPRMDRSDYDVHPIESILGVRSWLSVVSGARATR